MKTQTFGVEIEMILDREIAAEAIRKFLGGYLIHKYDCYSTIEISSTQDQVWKIMRDSSIDSADNKRCELVTPILHWDDIEKLQEILRILRKKGAKINSSCGIHVHVGAEKYTGQNMKNLINLFYSKDTILYKALNVRHSGVDRFCKKFREELIESVNKFKKPTIENILDCWYEELQRPGSGRETRNHKYNSSRYHGLNLHCYSRIKTIEFRMFNSTLHAGELKSYIHLALAISNQALKQKNARPAKTDEIINHNNLKYTFRCWLLRLKLIGDEFKNTRMHLLKKLEGNTVGNYRQAI